MRDMRVSDLQPVNINEADSVDMMVTADIDGMKQSRKINFSNISDELWKQMYVRTKSVIITCSHCGSANAITNSNCVSCGAPLGKDIEKK